MVDFNIKDLINEESSEFYYCFGSDKISSEQLDILRERLKQPPHLKKICLDRLGGFSFDAVSAVEEEMLEILLSHSMFTHLKIYCSKLNAASDNFLERVVQRAVAVKHIVLNFDDANNINNYISDYGCPGFVGSIQKSVTSCDLDVSGVETLLLQYHLNSVTQRNQEKQKSQQIFTKMVSDKISSFVKKLHSLNGITGPEDIIGDYVKQDYKEVQKLFTKRYINFLDRKQLDFLKKQYDNAIFQLASYYVAQKEYTQCCLLFVEEKRAVSCEPLFVMAFLEVFKDKNLLINNEIRKFTFSKLANLVKPEYSERALESLLKPGQAANSVSAQDLLAKVFLQTQKKRKSLNSGEELEQQVRAEEIASSLTASQAKYQQGAFFERKPKRRKLNDDAEDGDLQDMRMDASL